jgi:hypothetical protein
MQGEQTDAAVGTNSYQPVRTLKGRKVSDAMFVFQITTTHQPMDHQPKRPFVFFSASASGA